MMTIRRRIVGRVPSTRLADFFLAPSIHPRKNKKRLMFWVLGEGNSLGNPLVSFSFTSSLCIPHSAFRIPHSEFRIPNSAFRIPN